MTACVAPHCTADAEPAFTVGEPGGRLAGRNWQPGDVICLCWPHAMDVYATIGKTDPSQVAAWLRPDAADPPNTWRPPGTPPR